MYNTPRVAPYHLNTRSYMLTDETMLFTWSWLLRELWRINSSFRTKPLPKPDRYTTYRCTVYFIYTCAYIDIYIYIYISVQGIMPESFKLLCFPLAAQHLSFSRNSGLPTEVELQHSKRPGAFKQRAEPESKQVLHQISMEAHRGLYIDDSGIIRCPRPLQI